MTARHVLIVAAAATALVVVAGTLGMALFYARFFGFGQTPSTPEAEGLPGMTVVTFTSEDGREIRAWVAPPAGDRPVLVFFTGNYSSVGPSAARMRPFLDAGLGVAVLEYRGSSGSTETPSEENFARDARALYDRLDALMGRTIPAERRVIYGFSLGSAVAVRLAGERPVGAVVLEASFLRACDYFTRRYRGVPFCRLMWKNRFDVVDRIDRVEAPKLFLHGAHDTASLVAWGQGLYAAAPEPKTFVLYPEGGHSDLIDQGAADDVLEFVAASVGP